MAETNEPKRQIARRTAWIELPGEYEGFKAKVWINAPAKVWTAVQKKDATEEERQAAAAQLVLEHNNWCDFDGVPYPPPSEKAFWEEIPTELAACVFVCLQLEIGKLPNSLAPTRRR